MDGTGAGRAWLCAARIGVLPWLCAALLVLVAAQHGRAQAFEETALTIESRSGPIAFQVELAATPEQRRQGLMFREHLDSGRGMLFDFGRSEPVTMWMRNTYIPLDMLFIDDDGRIRRIVKDTPPLSDAVIGSGGPVRAVLELAAGTSADHGIAVGDLVVHPLFPAR